MKNFSLLLLLVAIGTISSAQNEHGIRLAFGQSWFEQVSPGYSPSLLNQGFYPNSSRIQEEYDRSFSTTFGYLRERPISRKSSIGIEATLSFIQGNNYTQQSFTDTIETYQHFNETYRRILYLDFPIYYSFRIKRLRLNLGLKTSFALSSYYKRSWRSTQSGLLDGTASNRADGNLDMYILDFGPRVGITFDVTKSLALECMYYHGTSNILKKTYNSTPTLKVRQATIGMRISIPQKDDKKTNETGILYYTDKGQENKTFSKRNSLLFQMGGQSIAYSINFERIINNGVRYKTLAQIGYGYFFFSDLEGHCIPTSVNQLFSFGSNHAEIGLGLTALLDDAEKSAILTSNVGYRYQKPDGKFIFRMGYNPLIPLNNDNDEAIEYLAHWFGISIGSAF